MHSDVLQTSAEGLWTLMSKCGGLDFWIPWTKEFHALSSISADSLWGPQSLGPSASQNTSSLTQLLSPYDTLAPNTKFCHSSGLHKKNSITPRIYTHRFHKIRENGSWDGVVLNSIWPSAIFLLSHHTFVSFLLFLRSNSKSFWALLPADT